jgi:hypothetical protein
LVLVFPVIFSKKKPSATTLDNEREGEREREKEVEKERDRELPTTLDNGRKRERN